MTKPVQFRISRPDAELEILIGNQGMQELEYKTMENLLPVIEAQFFQEFGVEGHFALHDMATDRYTVKIYTTDARTAAILSNHPKWLSQFTDNLKI